MRITVKDIELIRFVNKMKRVTGYQLMSLYGLTKQAIYKRLKRLVDEGYMEHESIFHEQPGVYYPTSKGVAVAGDIIPPAKVNLADYEHDLLVVDLAINFLKKYGNWLSEREIRSEKGAYKGIGLNLHVPDGIVNIDGKNIGIELELTRKGKSRLSKIFFHHLMARDYQETWYIVKDESIKEHLISNMDSKARQLIKVFFLSEVEDIWANNSQKM